MQTILAIAKNTFREAIRDKILYAILGFAVLFILSSLFIGQVANGDIVPVKSFGLTGIYLFGLIAAIFLGSSVVYKEIERRTLYFILSKPVSRTHIILGKFFGLLGAVALTIILMTILYEGIIFFHSGAPDYSALFAGLFQIMEAAVFIALLIFLSSIASPLIATLCSVIVLIVGHTTPAALTEAKLIGGVSQKFITVIYYVFPNLEKFDIRNLVIHDIAVPGFLFGTSLLYAVLYSVLLLFCAILLFKKREL